MLKISLPAAVAKQKSKQLIHILKDDYRLDILADIVEHIGYIKRAKKIRPTEKHRLLQNYYTTLLSYCVPKMKVVEDSTDKRDQPMNFQINIGVPQDSTKSSNTKGKSGFSITIPTNKNRDGSYSISADDADD